MKTGIIPKMGRNPQIPATSRGVPSIHQNPGESRTLRLSTRRKSIPHLLSEEVKKMNMTKRVAEEPLLPISMFLGGGGDSDDDDGCDHSDHSAESDADSPDTDAGE